MAADSHDSAQREPPVSDRRTFLSLASTATMATGLCTGYGMLTAGRFVYGGVEQEIAWLFVADESAIKVGDTVPFVTPAGQKVTLTRRGNSRTAEDFLALSSTCPHLGCQVHWEAQNNRFFCPCHNGMFDPSGTATAGPPAEAHQSLPHYTLKIDGGLIFIQAPVRLVGSAT